MFNHFDSFCYILEQFRARVLLNLLKMIRVIFQVMSPNFAFFFIIDQGQQENSFKLNENSNIIAFAPKFG